MAIIQPKIIHDATKGEKYLHNFFYKNLPDDVYVYYEKNIKTLLPDFIIVDPSSGVMVVEVKDWDIDFWTNAIVLDKDNFRVNGVSTKNPKEQALMYQNKLYGILRNSFSKQNKRKSTTRIQFPVNSIVAFPHLTRSEYVSLFDDSDQLESVLDPKHIIFKDDFERIERSKTSKDEFSKLIREMRLYDFYKGRSNISKDDMKLITASIDPKIIIGGSPDGLFRSMEQMQITESSFIPNSNRILRGIAGSGKSIMLLNQIDYICEHEEDKKILLVNYTNSLRAIYKEKYDNERFNNVSVLGLSETRNCDDCKFDYIFIDESQDFSKEELVMIISKKKSEDDSFVIMCTDWGQNLYSKNTDGSTYNYSFHELGIAIDSDNIYDLTVNYRNTLQIALLAHNCLHNDKIDESMEKDTMKSMYLTQMKSALRFGDKKPDLLNCENSKMAVDNVATQILKLVQEGADLNDIAILVHAKNEAAKPSIDLLIEKLNMQNINFFSLLDDNNKNKLRPDEHILLSTMHSAKGFEFKHVILYANFNPDRLFDSHKHVLYVGLTRAQETLTIVVDNPDGAITELFKKAISDTDSLLEDDLTKYHDTFSVEKAHMKYQHAFKRIRNIILMIKNDNVIEHLQPINDICKTMGFDIDSYESDSDSKANNSTNDNNIKYLDENNKLAEEKNHLIAKYDDLLRTSNKKAKAHVLEIVNSNHKINSLEYELKSSSLELNNLKTAYNELYSNKEAVDTLYEKAKYKLDSIEEKVKDNPYESEVKVIPDETEIYKKKYNRMKQMLIALVLIIATTTVAFSTLSLISWFGINSNQSNAQVIEEPYSVLGSIYYVPAKFTSVKKDLEFPILLDELKNSLSKYDKAKSAQGSYTTIKVITDPTNGEGKLHYENIVTETFFEGTTLDFTKDNETGEVYAHAYKFNEGEKEDLKKITVDSDAIGIQFSFANEFAVYNIDMKELLIFNAAQVDKKIRIELIDEGSLSN